MSLILLIMSLISEKLNIASVWGLLVLSSVEILVLTIMYIFSFFLVFKLYKSGVQIVHLIPDWRLFSSGVCSGEFLTLGQFNSWYIYIYIYTYIYIIYTYLYIYIYPSRQHKEGVLAQQIRRTNRLKDSY